MEPIRVLIVEDDPMVADINKNYAEAVPGYSVIGIAKNGREALDMIDRLQPDLLILDNYLPEVSGLEVLATLRRQERPLDIIMITAADDTVTVSKAMRLGIVAYITKPFKFDRYRAVLETYRQLRLEIGSKQHLDQHAIDRLATISLGSAGQEQEDLPKNYQSQTKERIVQFLISQQQAQSAEEVATSVGLSRVTARRYLELLVEQGLVERTLDYLTVGRPVHRFRLKK